MMTGIGDFFNSLRLVETTVLLQKTFGNYIHIAGTPMAGQTWLGLYHAFCNGIWFHPMGVVLYSAYLYLHKCTYKACAFHPGLILFHGLILGLSHYIDVIMIAMASQITSLTIVYSTVCSGADIKQHQSSASLAVVREIHRWPANSLHKGQVTRKMYLFDDVIMKIAWRFWTHICVTKETKAVFQNIYILHYERWDYP